MPEPESADDIFEWRLEREGVGVCRPFNLAASGERVWTPCPPEHAETRRLWLAEIRARAAAYDYSQFPKGWAFVRSVHAAEAWLRVSQVGWDAWQQEQAPRPGDKVVRVGC